jgi:hypothetical protein
MPKISVEAWVCGKCGLVLGFADRPAPRQCRGCGSRAWNLESDEKFVSSASGDKKSVSDCDKKVVSDKDFVGSGEKVVIEDPYAVIAKAADRPKNQGQHAVNCACMKCKIARGEIK